MHYYKFDNDLALLLGKSVLGKNRHSSFREGAAKLMLLCSGTDFNVINFACKQMMEIITVFSCQSGHT